MHGFFKYPKFISLMAMLSLSCYVLASENQWNAFNQDIHIKSSKDGDHLISLSESLKSKNALDLSQVIERIKYSGVNGQSHQLLSTKVGPGKTLTIPEAHRLSAKVLFNGLNESFVLPEMEFNVGLVVLEWQQLESSVSHMLTSTWLLNSKASEQFSDKRSQTLSIRPMLNSRFLTVGNDLPVRLYYQMGAVSENLYAKNHATGEVNKVTSDVNGMAAVKLNHPGLWTLMVVRQDADKKYISFLNFDVSEASVKKVGVTQ